MYIFLLLINIELKFADQRLLNIIHLLKSHTLFRNIPLSKLDIQRDNKQIRRFVVSMINKSELSVQ